MQGLIPLASSQCLRKLGFASIRFFSGVGGGRPHRDSYYYTRQLQSCNSTRTLNQIHAQIITAGCHQNPFLTSKLVSQYAVELSSPGMDDARKVFDQTPHRDVLLWNVMIRGFATLGPFTEAITVYDQMRQSGISLNGYTYPFVLKACGAIGDGRKGREIHGHALKSGMESDLFVGNALVAFYAKCGEIEMARKLFDEIPVKDLVTWNSMISGYSQNECAQEALLLLHQMLQDESKSNTMPDFVTLVGLLPACAKMAAVQEGMWIHSYVIKSGMEVNVVLGSGLIGMYANCGRLLTARQLFDLIPDKNLVVWNAMIRGYGMHGHASEALELFSRMSETGLMPDGICFLSVLSTCSHAGMVKKGWEIFKLMGNCGVERSELHYACMVDILGRSGQLNEAVEFVKAMPMEAGKDVLGALLGACRIHNDMVLAEEIAERLFVLDPDNAGRYVILAKMYEEAGRGKDAARVRMMMKKMRVRKPLGCSVIEVESLVHTFGVEDESHPMTVEIYDVVEQLGRVVEEVVVVAGVG